LFVFVHENPETANDARAAGDAPARYPTRFVVADGDGDLRATVQP
jgi:hypothetical protein